MGWCIEIIWTGFESLANGDLRLMGFTNLWMFFIYGCAVFLEPLHERISKQSWPVRGIVWLTVIWSIEYVTGLLLLNILGVYPWFYTDKYAVLGGLVTLRFAPVWFFGGLLFERIHTLMDSYVTKTDHIIH